MCKLCSFAISMQVKISSFDNKFLYIKTEKDLNIGLKIFEVKLLKNPFYKIYGVKYKQYIENGFDI